MSFSLMLRGGARLICPGRITFKRVAPRTRQRFTNTENSETADFAKNKKTDNPAETKHLLK